MTPARPTRAARAGPSTRPRASGALDPRAVPAGRGTWVALAVLVAARALFAVLPWRGLWGWDVQRFLDPALAWGSWIAMALCATPLVARALSAPGDAAGRALRSPWGVALAMALAAALVWSFPDRLHYVGDFLMRIGAVRQEESPDVLSPQAFPLDLVVHYALPLEGSKSWGLAPEVIVRLAGALGAALLAGAAALFASAVAATPAGRLAAFAATCFGGALCLFTGESKAFAEMVIVVVAFLAFTLRAVRAASDSSPELSRRASLALLGASVCLAVGLLFHRYALGLLPAWLLTVWRVAALEPARRSFVAWLAMLLPVVVLVVLGPRIVQTVLTYDLGANFSGGGAGGGAAWRGLLAPLHLLDVANLVLFLAPAMVVALPAIAAPRSADTTPGPGRAIVLALLIPFALVMLVARPPQGALRDWDSFAVPGIAIALAAAWALARAIDAGRAPGLAAPLAIVTALGALQWLAHFADAPRGRARLEQLMIGPPPREAVDRARTWDFLGWRWFRDENYEASAAAFEHAVEAAPSPRNLTHWAMAETMRGRPERALSIYQQAVERDSNLTLGWFGVGVSAINSGDRAAAETAARALTRLAPTNPKTLEIIEWLERTRATSPAPQRQ